MYFGGGGIKIHFILYFESVHKVTVFFLFLILFNFLAISYNIMYLDHISSFLS